MRRPEFIARQSRHPRGWLGAIIGRIMARETVADNERAITMLGIEPDDHVLDIGTGHGRSLGVMAAIADKGLVVGVDGSDAMLKIATRDNGPLIAINRVRVEKAASDALPFADGSFDKAIAMHTLYFWNPAEPHLREIVRILKKGGTFVLGFPPAEDTDATARFPNDVHTFRATPVAEALLLDAGFEILGARRRDVSANSMVWLLARKA